MSKSRDAFRTISEVSDWLDTPAHVLRFWESRFSQIKPMKRAGGRRYYRPNDMRLIGGIKKLLHDDGMTIRGVQKILREQGIKHVSSLSPEVTGDVDDTPDQETVVAAPSADAPTSDTKDDVAREAEIVSMFATADAGLQAEDIAQDAIEDAPETDAKPDAKADATAPADIADIPVEAVESIEETPPLAEAPQTPDVAAPELRPTPATPPSFLRTAPNEGDPTGIPMPTRLRDLADLGAIPKGQDKASLTGLYRRLQALRDRVASEL